jgi:DNA-binding NarL/FixJ family response regulator
MRPMKPKQSFHPEHHGNRGARKARRAERRTSPHVPADPSASPALTPRQRDVAALLVGTGLSYKQIAARLALSEGTVRTHTERIYRAFGVHSRPELTVALRVPGECPPPAPQA